MNIQKYLKTIGLSENEQKVYLVSLEVGESQITPLVHKASMPRTTIYYILEKLRNLGLIEIFQRNSRRLYKPTPPRQILTLLKNKKERLTEEVDTFSEALPEIAKMYHSSPFQPKIKVYRGREIRKIYDDILESPINRMYHVGKTSQIVNLLGMSYVKKFIRQRAELKIRSQVIRVRSENSENAIDDPIFKQSSKFLRAVRWAPEKFKSPTHVLIYGNNVAFVNTTSESFGVVVTSQELSKTMQSWFHELWERSSTK